MAAELRRNKGVHSPEVVKTRPLFRNCPIERVAEAFAIPTVSEYEPVAPSVLRFSTKQAAFARHAAIHVVANLGALACNGILAFVLPHFLSVDDYGYYRLFLLYGSFAGTLHLGFLDGLLIRWAARPRSRLNKELSNSLAFLGLEHFAILAMILAITIYLVPRYTGLALAFAAYSILWNWSVLGQYAIQALKLFEEVSFFTLLAPLLLLLSVVILPALSLLTLRNLIGACLLSNLVGAAWLWKFVRQNVPRSSVSARATRVIGLAHMRLGWSVLAANLLAVVALSLDRLVLSRRFSIRDFAIYSFAANTLALTYNMILSVARVLFPYLSDGVSAESRLRAYAAGEIIVVLLWAAGLTAYFPIAWLIARWLPNYSSSLPLIRILMLATGFTASIHLLHSTYFRLARRQNQFLKGALAGCLSAAVFLGIAMRGAHLNQFAWAMIGSALIWWMVNEYLLRDLLGQNMRKILKSLALIVLCGFVFLACVSLYNLAAGCAVYLTWTAILCVVVGQPLLRRFRVPIFDLLYSTSDDYGRLS